MAAAFFLFIIKYPGPISSQKQKKVDCPRQKRQRNRLVADIYWWQLKCVQKDDLTKNGRLSVDFVTFMVIISLDLLWLTDSDVDCFNKIHRPEFLITIPCYTEYQLLPEGCLLVCHFIYVVLLLV